KRAGHGILPDQTSKLDGSGREFEHRSLSGRSMSVATLGHVRVMSALPPKSGHSQALSECPQSATGCHMHRSKLRLLHLRAIQTNGGPRGRWASLTKSAGLGGGPGAG